MCGGSGKSKYWDADICNASDCFKNVLKTSDHCSLAFNGCIVAMGEEQCSECGGRGFTVIDKGNYHREKAQKKLMSN
jgi:hypothetical protein